MGNGSSWLSHLTGDQNFSEAGTDSSQATTGSAGGAAAGLLGNGFLQNLLGLGADSCPASTTGAGVGALVGGAVLGPIGALVGGWAGGKLACLSASQDSNRDDTSAEGDPEVEQVVNRISPQGAGYIASAEGFRGELYEDDAGHCTVGYGHLVHLGACNGDVSEAPFTGGISQEDAVALFSSKLVSYEDAVTAAFGDHLTQGQFDALTSFAYNLGPEYFNPDSPKYDPDIVENVKSGNFEAATAEMQRYTYASGVELPGLVKRRQDEASIFQNGFSADTPLNFPIDSTVQKWFEDTPRTTPIT